jgi:hypothetical protein
MLIRSQGGMSASTEWDMEPGSLQIILFNTPHLCSLLIMTHFTNEER